MEAVEPHPKPSRRIQRYTHRLSGYGKVDKGTELEVVINITAFVDIPQSSGYELSREPSQYKS